MGEDVDNLVPAAAQASGAAPMVDDYVLNRARLYRDRRDFMIKPGDTGTR